MIDGCQSSHLRANRKRFCPWKWLQIDDRSRRSNISRENPCEKWWQAEENWVQQNYFSSSWLRLLCWLFSQNLVKGLRNWAYLKKWGFLYSSAMAFMVDLTGKSEKVVYWAEENVFISSQSLSGWALWGLKAIWARQKKPTSYVGIHF